MKKFIGLILVLILFGCGSKENNIKADSQKTDVEKSKLKDQVKHFKESTYSAKFKFGKIDKTGGALTDIEKSYNKKGYETKVKYDYKYMDRLVEYIIEYDKNQTLKKERKYYLNGKLKEDIFYEYEFNKNAKEKICFKYDTDKNLIGKEVFLLDDSGNILEKNYLDSSGNLKEKHKIEYNKAGQKTKYINYDSYGDYKFKASYTYDPQGRSIESFIEYKKSLEYLSQRFEYAYENESTKEYNSETVYGKESIENIKTFTYEYDDHNNWIKKIALKNGEPYEITIREISYY